MTKVGPGTSPVASTQVVKSGGQVVKSSGQVENAAISVKLDITKLNALLQYCTEPRTRAEMQAFCEIVSRDYFRNKVLLPLLESGRLKRTIPDKPNSSKQKYIRA
jgi:ATP-dependent DNA helicase RecG